MKVNQLAGDSFLRKPNDFYRTPPVVTKSLLDREGFPGWVWEPACGDGAISKVLKKEGLLVYSSDRFDQGYGIVGKDFLSCKAPKKFSHVITNPPAKHAEAFIKRATEIADHKVAFLLKLNFLAGARRYREIFQWNPPARLYVFCKRISFYETEDRGILEYAWYVWERGKTGKPEISWILL